ncbi:MAG TPA: 6-phosphogluconolactonase, partial [Candidatus Xenobia bacterium]
DNIPRWCTEYERAISESGGVDLQILGIGEDGHIGFNEPTSSLGSRTRLKTLTDATTHQNQMLFKKHGGYVPRHVITMGVGTILESRRCLMLACGAHKADAVAAMVEGPVTAFCPASALQLHPDTIALMDEDAARHLKLSSYYRNVYRNKPEWQQLI